MYVCIQKNKTVLIPVWASTMYIETVQLNHILLDTYYDIKMLVATIMKFGYLFISHD